MSIIEKSYVQGQLRSRAGNSTATRRQQRVHASSPPAAGRTFAWLNRQRRLGKDCKYLTDTGEAMIEMAMIGLMLRRLTAKSKQFY